MSKESALENMKCSADRTYENGSCYTFAELKTIANFYNTANPKNKIIFDKNESGNNKEALLKEITNRLKDNCDDQQCWLDESFIDSNTKNTLKDQVFRPEGPYKGTEWLSNFDINNVFSQYERKHKDFKFLGSVPRDFQKFGETRQTEEFYDNLIKEGKTKMGMVYNTDVASGSGEHWNAMFADFDKQKLYFFDSYAEPPNKDVKNHLKLLKSIMHKMCSSDKKEKYIHNHNSVCNGVDEEINKDRAQYKGSECGVYSTVFIIRMLEGSTFANFCKAKIPDDEINRYRSVLFSK